MRHLKSILVVLALALVGCTERELNTGLSGDFNFSFSGELPDLQEQSLNSSSTRGPADPESSAMNLQTRSGLGYVVRLGWEEGDEVSVINLTTGKTLGGNLKADKSGSVTTFSGTLSGNIASSDRLLVVYPCQNYTSAGAFSGITFDGFFDEQDGLTPSEAPFIALAQCSLDQLSVSSAAIDFEFGMSFFQMNLLGLPESSEISDFSLYGFNSSATLTWDGSDLVWEYSEPGSILLESSSLQTDAFGNRSVYFTCFPQDEVDYRGVELAVGDIDVMTFLPVVEIAAATNYNFNLYYDDFSSDLYEVTVSSNVESCDYTAVSGFDPDQEEGVIFAAEGSEIVLEAVPASGYVLSSVSVVDGSGVSVPVTVSGNTISFTMPADIVSVNLIFSGVEYSVNVASVQNGSVSVSKTSASSGDGITVTATPASGYELSSVSVVTSSGTTVSCYATSSGYFFTMPSSAVTVSATFVKSSTGSDAGWYLVTNDSELIAGDKYIMVAYGGTSADGSYYFYAMGNSGVTVNPYYVQSTLVVPSADYSTVDVSTATGLMEFTLVDTDPSASSTSFKYQFICGDDILVASGIPQMQMVSSLEKLSGTFHSKFAIDFYNDSTYGTGTYAKIWGTTPADLSKQPYICSGFFYTKTWYYQFDASIIYYVRLYHWVD